MKEVIDNKVQKLIVIIRYLYKWKKDALFLIVNYVSWELIDSRKRWVMQEENCKKSDFT